MSVLKTNRPFSERFLDGYDRSQLRQEVQKAKRSRFTSLKKKYAGWALGGALALGGIGIPLKVGSMLKGVDDTATRRQSASLTALTSPEPTSTAQQIARDLKTANQIAAQVAGGVASGVTGAASEVAKTVSPAVVAQVVTEAPKALAAITDQAREAFFKKEIPFGSIIYSEAMKNDLPPELVAAVVHTESRFVPTARSQAGAIGLMQLVPRTGRWLGARNLTDPAENITAGAKYLRYLTDRFGGNTQNAIAAYNAGEGNVRRFGGVPPFRETRNYVQRVQSFQHDLGVRLDSHMADLAP